MRLWLMLRQFVLQWLLQRLLRLWRVRDLLALRLQAVGSRRGLQALEAVL
jgi:hypothetical protein